MIAEKLQIDGVSLDQDDPFDEFEGGVLISIGLDNPEYFASIHHLIDPSAFSDAAVSWVLHEMLKAVKKYNVIPTRAAFVRLVKDNLNTDTDRWEDIERLISRPASYRDVPVVKAKLDAWIKFQQIRKLYDSEGLTAYKNGDYHKLAEIVDGVTRLNQESYRYINLVDSIDEVFLPDNNTHMTTGFNGLDRYLNDGGPSPGEVLLYMGPTNVGKSIFLCNTASAHYRAGYETLLITFELDIFKTARRILSPYSGVPIGDLENHLNKLRSDIRKNHATHGNKLILLEWPPDEIHVDNVYAALQNLKRSEGFVPQSIIIDYMDLMTSKRQSDNNDGDYTRQKYVANQIRGLAKNTQALVTTATQTNRSGNDSTAPIGLDRAAESYGKTMPLDYVVTINQSPEEHSRGKIRLWVAKNRNGPKNVTVHVDVNYNIMSTRESVGV